MNQALMPSDIALDLAGNLLKHFQNIVIPSDFDKAINILSQTRGQVLISGLGKSGHIARLIAATLRSLNIRATFLHAAEALHGDMGIIHATDSLLILSNSGKTPECIELSTYAKKLQIPCISMTANADSYLARSSDAVLLYPAEELCLWQRIPSLSTLNMHRLGILLAMTLQKMSPSYTENDYLIHHPAGTLGLDARAISNLYLPLAHIAQAPTSASIRTTIQLIQQAKLGCALILDNPRELRGIFTDGDLRRALLSNADLNEPVINWLTPKPIVILENMLVGEVKKIFIKNKITTAPVQSTEGCIIGLITHYQLEA